MIICPRCGQENKENTRNCINCDVNLKYALETAEKYQAEQKSKELESQLRERELEQLRIRITNLTLTTTPGIDGKTISQYLGIVSSVVVVLGLRIEGEMGAAIINNV